MATRRLLIAAILALSPWLAQFPAAFASSAAQRVPAAKVEPGNQPRDQETPKEKELKRLQSILGTLNQELEATYRQFQMVQEARRGIVQSMFDARPGLDPRSYDEMVKDRDQALAQEKELSGQMNRLLDKAKEIESRMNPVLDRIYQLIPDSGSGYQSGTQLPAKPENEASHSQMEPNPY